MRRQQLLAMALVLGLSACTPPFATMPTGKPSDGIQGYQVQQVSFLTLVNMRNQINVARERVNAPPVLLDSNLSRIAEMHAKDMVDREYFGDTAPTGIIKREDLSVPFPTPWIRILRSQASGKRWAPRNFLRGFLRVVPAEPQDTIGSRILFDDPDGWLVRDRALITISPYTRLGIGIAYHPNERTYYAVMYMADGERDYLRLGRR